MTPTTTGSGLRQRVFTSSALNLFDFGLKFASVLVVSPFLIQQLGKEGYGIWFLIFSIASYLELLDLGLANTAVRFIGRSLGLRDSAEGRAGADRVFAWFKRLYRRIGISALGLAAIGTAAAAWFSLDDGAPDDLAVIMALCAFPLAMSFFFRPYRCLLKGHVLYHRLIAASAVRTVLFSAGVFAVLGTSPRIASLAVLWAGCALLEQVLIWVLARPVAYRYRPVPITPGSVPESRDIGGYAGKQVVLALANFLRNRVDVQILGAAIGPVAVTYYAVGIRFVDLFKDLMTAVFGGNFLAAFAQMNSRGRPEEVTNQVLAALRLSTGLAASFVVGLLTLAPPFIDRWLGPGFGQAHLVVYMLVPSLGFYVAQYPAVIYLGSINRHGLLALIGLVGSLMNFMLSLLLVWLIGFEGVIVATSIEMAVLALWVLPILFCRRSKISFLVYFRILARSLVAVSPAAVLGAWLSLAWHLESYLGLACAGAVLAFACLVFLYLLLLSREERQGVHRIIRHLRSKSCDMR